MTEGNTESKEILLFANEKVQQPAPVIYVDGVKLKKNKDYILLYEDTQEGAYVEPGTWSIMVKGIGNYDGAVEFDFRILENTRIKAEKLTISGLKTVSYEEGVPAEPKPIVKYKGTTLEEGTHYSLRYEDNTKAGKATLILTGLEKEGEYNIVGTVTKTFKVKGVQIGKASIDYQKVVTYNGAEQKPKVTLTYKDDTLLEGRDYHVTYTNNQKVGTATIMITGDKGFEGSIKKTFKINPEPVDEKNLRITFVSGEAEFAYENSGVKPEVIVTKGSTLLLEGTDYTVSYKNNKKLAKKTDEKAPEVIVKGKGKYKGSASVWFSIGKKDLKDSEDEIQIVSADKLINKNGKYQSAPVVTDSKGKKLKLNKDYKILGYYVGESELPTVQKDLVKGTTVKVKIEGMGNYTGPAETTYRIVEKNLSKVKVKIKDQNYTGEAITFTEEDFINGTIIVTPPKGSEPLVYGVDYVIDEESYQNHVKKGTAKVTLKGISDTWGGTKIVKYTIKVKQVQ